MAPDGTGMVVWSAPLTNGEGYSIYVRPVGVGGVLGTKLAVSAPGGAYTSAYAPTVHYDAPGTATAVWLESTYSSDACFAESGEGGEECVVDEYVRARQIGAGGSLSPVRELQHRQVVFPAEGSFGGSSPAYVTYGQPVVANGPSGTLTVLWTESTFGSGCSAYGYSRSYVDSECEADQKVKWVRLSASAVPQGVVRSALESHTSGYGSGQPLLQLRAAAAADGTITVLFSARRSGDAGECWGGESSVGFFRIETDGEAEPATELDSGCGSASPDLALDPGGAAVAVWGWANTYSGDEALYARIDSGGSASAPQTLLDSAEGASVSGLDLARGAAGTARAVWAAEGSIRSRSIPFTGSLGPTGLVAAAPANRYFFAPRLAAGPDGSAVIVWESSIGGGSAETALQAAALGPDGIAHSPRTLLAPNRRDHGARVSAGPSGSFLASWRVSVPQRNRIQSIRFGVESSASNDAFAATQPLEAELPSFAAGSNVDASKQPGEPNHAGDPGGASVWFSWTAPSSGPVTLAICASEGLDPTLAVYTGSSLAALTPVAVATGGAPRPCSEGDAGVRFDALAGTTYRIAVDGQGGSEGSFGLKLSAREEAPPNDSFAAAKQIPGGLVHGSFRGSNVNAGHEPGEPNHAGDPGGASVWFSWTAPDSTEAQISACGQDLGQPLLAIYGGSELADLTEVGSDASGECSVVPFDAVAGTTYRIAVDGKDGREGNFQLRFVRTPANDDLAEAQPLIGAFPSASEFNFGVSKEPGEPNHAGDPGGHSLWFSWTPYTDVTAVISACLQAVKAKSALLGVYTGTGYGDLEQVAADAGGVSSGNCSAGESQVRAEFTGGTKYLIALDGEDGAEGLFSLRIDLLPANDSFAAAQEIDGLLPQTRGASTRYATKQPGEPNHAGVPGGASVWFAWTAPSSGSAKISTCTYAGPSLALAVYTGSDLTHLTAVGSDLGGGSGGCFSPRSEVEFEAAKGTRYYFAVDGPGTAGAFFELQLSLEAAATNDAFANPRSLGSESSAFVQAGNHLASKEPDEPNHAGSPGGASVWFSWTAPESRTFGVSTCASGSLEPLLAVYTGSSIAGLGQVAASAGPEPGPCQGEEVKTRFQAVAGTTYRIAVDGKGASSGNLSLELGRVPANDDFAAAKPLPADLPLSESGSTRFGSRQPLEPAHGGAGGGASVWYSWTAVQAGELELSACSFGSLEPVLRLYVGSSLASLTPITDPEISSGSCDRTRFAATAGTTYRIAVDGKDGSEGSFQLELRGRPANDRFADAQTIGAALPEYLSGDNRLATKEASEPNHAGDPGGASTWFSWTPAKNELVSISTCSYGSLDPVLAIYTGSSLGGLVGVASSDDSDHGGCSPKDSEARFSATAGTTYRIAVDGKSGTSGPFELRLRPAAANDGFASAQALPNELPVSTWSSNLVATKEASEPNHAGDPGGASTWFSWTAPSSGSVKVVTCSWAFDDVDPLLAVYTGSSLGGLTEVAANDDSDHGGCSPEDSDVRFTAVAGATYRIAVDGKGGRGAEFQLQLSAAGPANDDFEDAIDVPQAAGAIAGSNAAAGRQVGEPSGAEQTVWYRLVATRSELVRLHTCSDGGGRMDLDVFTGPSVGALKPVAAAATGTTTACSLPTQGSSGSGSGDAPVPAPTPGGFGFGDTPVLAFAATAGTTYWISVDRYFQISPVIEQLPAGPFQLVVNPPANDLRASAEQLPVRGASLTRTNVGATREPAELEHAGEAGGHSIWFSWFATADGPATVDTCGSEIDTLLAVEDFAGEVGSSDDSEECGLGSVASSVTFEAEEGTRYSFAVDGKGGETGQVRLDVAFAAPDVTPPETFAYVPVAIKTPQLNFSLSRDEPESSFECALDGAPFIPCAVSGPEYFLIGTISGLAEGTHTLAVREVDAAGNADPTPVSHQFRVDMVPPETSFSSGPEGLTRFLGSFELAADEPGYFECALDGAQMTFCPTPYTAPDSLADGKHTLTARATDLAGNADPTPATRSFDLDRTPPLASVDAGPVGTIEVSQAEFQFSVNEQASFRCRLDGHDLGLCGSPLKVTGIGDGDHVFAVRPTDAAGNVGELAEWEFRVETKPPQTTITSGPQAFDPNDSTGIGFVSSESPSTFECALDEAALAPCESPHLLTGLGDGEHSFSVRATDAGGKVDPTPAELTWTVDTVAPQTTITAGPTAPIHRPALEFEFDSNEPVSKFQCAVDDGEFRSCSGIAHDRKVGAHRFAVRAYDRAGNVDPTPAESEFEVVDEPPTATLALDRSAGSAPLPVTASIAGTDPDEDTLTYSVQWGDGSQTSGSLPRAPLAHTYEEPGLYLATLAVSDGFGPARVVTELVSVGPAEAVRADAGDDRRVTVGETVAFDGGNSRPSSEIASYEWSFGDGDQGSGKAVTHVYSSPGSYEVGLAIAGPAGSATDTAKVEVVPPVPTPVKVHVHDDGTPIANALVMVTLADGGHLQAVSGADGVATLPALPDGRYRALAYREGYLPGGGDVEVADGTGTGEIELEPGALAKLIVDSDRLTLDEIEDLGIDPNDPDNQHVFEFTIHIGTGSVSGYVNRRGPFGSGCERIGSTTCHFNLGGYRVSMGTRWPDGADGPVVSSLAIPARATFLKEFYEVTATVQSFASPEFVLGDGHAQISVPGGMSLAPTASPQSSAIEVPAIAGGEARSLRWILRGDVEGEYDVGIDYAATLEPFGRPFQMHGETEEPIKVWGASALKLTVDVDEEMRDGYPFTAFVELRNVADVPVYNATVELLREGRQGYIEQPRQRRHYDLRELAPGEKLTAGPFVLVPEASGEVDLDRSFVRKVAGDTGLNATVRVHEREPSFEQTPKVEARWRNEQDLVLDWEPVPGATDYEIYATPDRQTDFPEGPLSPHEFDTTKAMVSIEPDEEPPLLAISSVIGGERRMVHPLVTSIEAGEVAYPSIQILDRSRCGEREAEAMVIAKDPDFPLTAWGYAVGGGEATANQPLGSPTEVGRTIKAIRAAGHLADVHVAFTNANPADGVQRRAASIGECDYVALGDSFSSGEGAVAPGSQYEDGGHRCHRSPQAYGRLLDLREDLDLQAFKPCSGAITADVHSVDHGGVPPQIDVVDGAALVTLSMGGNDLGFANVLETCIPTYLAQALNPVPFLSVPCKVYWGPEVESRLPNLEQELQGALELIAAKAADDARVILVGYPQIFPAEKPPVALSVACQAIHPSDLAWMHDLVTRVNQRLAAVALAADAEFVDPNVGGHFAGNDVCQLGDASSFNGILKNIKSPEQFHPNVRGQAALRYAVENQVDHPRTRRYVIEEGDSAVDTFLLEGVRMLRARMLWPGSDIELILESPSGIRYDRSTTHPAATHEVGPTSESYLIPNAEPGTWKVEMKGLETEEGGEPVTLDVDQVPVAPVPPLAVFTASAIAGTAPLQVAFDASGSLDPEGQALTYSWDFGDGTGGSAIAPVHTYADEGEYVATLTVVDEEGESDTFLSEPIVVAAKGTQPGGPGDPGPADPGRPTDPGSAAPDTPSPGGGAPAAPGQVGSAPAAPPTSSACRKGFKKKKVRGKAKCVKAKKKRGRKHR